MSRSPQARGETRVETRIRITGEAPDLSPETFHLKGPVGLVAPGDGRPSGEGS